MFFDELGESGEFYWCRGKSGKLGEFDWCKGRYDNDRRSFAGIGKESGCGLWRYGFRGVAASIVMVEVRGGEVI